MLNVCAHLGREATSAGGQRWPFKKRPWTNPVGALGKWAQMGTNAKLYSGGGWHGHTCSLRTAPLV